MRYYWLIMLVVFSSFSQNSKEVDSLLQITHSQKSDSIKIEALNSLFFIEVYSSLDKSKEYFNTIFKIAKHKNSNFAYAKAYNLKGVYYDFSGKLDSANYCYYQAIKYSKLCKNILIEGSALNNIGLLYWNKGNYYQAILMYNKALQNFEKVGNKKYQANVLSNIGLIYDEIGENEKAEQYLEKALKIRKEINDKYGLSVSYVNLGKAQDKQNKYSQAISNYDKSIAIKREINDLLGIAIANNNKSTVLLKLNQNDEALKCLKEAEDNCIKSKAESNIVENVYTGLVQVYLEKDNISKAKEYNEKLFLLTQKTKDNDRLSDYYGFKSEIAFKEKDYKSAYVFKNKYDSIHKIVEGIELKKAINLYETKYQTKQKENELLQTKNALYQKEIENKRKTTWIIIIGIVTLFTALIGFLFFRQQKLKNIQQQQEFKLKEAIVQIENQNKLQEQRLSISRDLHDNIGAQLTFIISSVENLKFGYPNIDEKIKNQLTKVGDFTRSTIIELRDTIWAMNGNEFTVEDLRIRMANFIEKAQSSSEKINFKFCIDDNLKSEKFSSLVGINIYRTIQEAVNNAMKYSNASEISVKAKQINETMQIIVEDNGDGFDMEITNLGNGLHNMKKRIEEIGGNFEINSIKNKGTQIRIELKIK